MLSSASASLAHSMHRLLAQEIAGRVLHELAARPWPHFSALFQVKREQDNENLMEIGPKIVLKGLNPRRSSVLRLPLAHDFHLSTAVEQHSAA